MPKISFQMARARSQHFFLLFGRDMYIPTLANLLQPILQYLGEKSSLLLIEMLREVFMLAVRNLKKAIDKQNINRAKQPQKFKLRYLVHLKNHMKQTCNTKYMPNVHICKGINEKAYDLQESTGHVFLWQISNY